MLLSKEEHRFYIGSSSSLRGESVGYIINLWYLTTYIMMYSVLSTYCTVPNLPLSLVSRVSRQSSLYRSRVSPSVVSRWRGLADLP